MTHDGNVDLSDHRIEKAFNLVDPAEILLKERQFENAKRFIAEVERVSGLIRRNEISLPEI